MRREAKLGIIISVSLFAEREERLSERPYVFCSNVSKAIYLANRCGSPSCIIKAYRLNQY